MLDMGLEWEGLAGLVTVTAGEETVACGWVGIS